MKDDRDWGFNDNFNRKLWTLNNELLVGVTKFWWSKQNDRVMKKVTWKKIIGTTSRVEKTSKIKKKTQNLRRKHRRFNCNLGNSFNVFSQKFILNRCNIWVNNSENGRNVKFLAKTCHTESSRKKFKIFNTVLFLFFFVYLANDLG